MTYNHEHASTKTRTKDLCRRCEKNDHSHAHDPILGCLATVAPEPRDFQCKCISSPTLKGQKRRATLFAPDDPLA